MCWPCWPIQIQYNSSYLEPLRIYFWFGLGLSASPCDEPGFAPLHYSHDHHVLTQVLTFLHSPYGLDVGQVWCSGLLNDQPRVPEPLHNLHPASLGWCSQNPFRYICLKNKIPAIQAYRAVTNTQSWISLILFVVYASIVTLHPASTIKIGKETNTITLDICLRLPHRTAQTHLTRGMDLRYFYGTGWRMLGTTNLK